MVKNILFDMGGVLLRFEPRLFVGRLGLDDADSEIILREVFHSLEWVCMDRNSMTEEEAFRSMCTRIPTRLHAAAREVFDHWDMPRLEMDGAYDLVKELSDNGYGLYLLSNASVRHSKYWPDLPLSKFFGDRLMVSAFHGVMKPEAAFFEKAFELFSLDRRECLFIDDFPVNMEGAMRVGLDGIVYHGDPELLRVRLREKGVKI
ncbi:MAG: HAD-IA family hydrolase [Oscillospiraceae bacterium]|nr:HAD-IA family hydrolase [Oscillospiraceae bacterium]